jgi:hypothetical protein
LDFDTVLRDEWSNASAFICEKQSLICMRYITCNEGGEKSSHASFNERAGTKITKTDPHNTNRMMQ